MLELVILCFSVVANLALAALVFAKNAQKSVNEYFAFFAFTLVGWSITNYISLHPVLLDQLFWIRLDMAWAALLSLSLVMLVNVFPTDRPYFKRLEKPAVAVGILVTLSAMTPWLFTSVDYATGDAEPVPGPLIVPFGLFAFSALGTSIYVLLRRFRSLHGRAREYVRYAMFGMVAMFSLIIFFNFIVVIVFKSSSFIGLTPLFVLIFSVSFVYGMVWRRLFDVRLIVARFVAYLAVLVFASVLYAFTAAALSFFVTGVQPTVGQIIPSTIVVGILVLVAQPMRRLFNRMTRAVFYQDDYNTKDILDELASVLVRGMGTDMVARQSSQVLKDTLKSRYVTMFLKDPSVKSGWRRISSGAEFAPRSLPAALLEIFDQLPDVAMEDGVERTDVQYKALQEIRASVVARLETQSGVVGYTVFGDKTSGSAYTNRDIELIRIARDELAIAIENTMRFDEIQAFNTTLQERIEDATRELRNSNMQLQRLDAAKDEFISMASHQLRTPLTSVKGYLSMVLEGDAGKISQSQRQLLSEAFTSSERMVHLIGDFLNVSRLQTGKFTLEMHPVDLSKLVEQEVDSLRTTAEAHGLTIRYRRPSHFPILNLDEAKMRQVVMNYIDNAIFYSHEGSPIDVKLSTEAGFAVLEVKDRGIGVPQAEFNRLYTKFFRASNARKQRPDGTGVGLFLTRKVISAHHGSLIMESVENEGSTFGFRLPIKKLDAGNLKELHEKNDNENRH